jgi:LacI family transcriptional regulator
VVLNNRVCNVRVSPATRLRVQEAARRLNYRPSLQARGLRSAKSYLIGVAAMDVNAAFLADLLGGIREGVGDPDYCSIVETYSDFPSQQAAINRLLHRRVDGIIATGAVGPDGKTDETLYASIRETTIPVVEIFGNAIPKVPKVNVDNAGAAQLLTKHLLELGHRTIALLTHAGYDAARRSGSLHHDAWDQFQGYETTLRHAGNEPLVITYPVPQELNAVHFVNEQYIRSGRDSARAILDHPRRPTAVICYNALTAAGLLRACHELGIAVPGQLSVATNCEPEFAQTMLPTLTGVVFPMREIGQQAMRMLWELLQARSVSSIRVAGELVTRESTAPPPAR